jgi:hypothetical protein
MNIDLALNILRGVRDRNNFTDPGYVLALNREIKHITTLCAELEATKNTESQLRDENRQCVADNHAKCDAIEKLQTDLAEARRLLGEAQKPVGHVWLFRGMENTDIDKTMLPHGDGPFPLFLSTPVPAQQPQKYNFTDFAEWLEREMPPGTVISNPTWWANKIHRKAIMAAPAAQQPVVPEAVAKDAARWVRQTPDSIGAYYVRGWLCGDKSQHALVEVRADETLDGESEGSVLVCNLHFRNSDCDVTEWDLLSNCSDSFEWLGPLDAAILSATDTEVKK